MASFHVVDGVHTIVDANRIKDERRKRQGKGARDGKTCWGAKAKLKITL